MTEFPRLNVDQPEPPAPLPFRDFRRETDSDAEPAERADDAIVQAERALNRAQNALNELDRLTDEAFAPIKFRPDDGDDDGPRAA